MSEQQPQAGVRPEPIFTIDTECPRCAYNLRELTEPRCPECGLIFQPHRLVQEATYRRHRSGLWRIARTLYRHPVAFWQQPEMRHDCNARREHLRALLFFGASPGTLTEIGYQHLSLWRRLRFAMLLSLWPFLFLLMFAPLAVSAVHGTIIWIASVIQRKPASPRAVAAAVGFPSLWLMPAMASMLLCLRVLPDAANLSRRVPGWVGMRGTEIALMALSFAAAMFFVIACLCWTASLYTGARRALNASRFEAFLCVLSSPGWCAMLALWMMRWQ